MVSALFKSLALVGVLISMAAVALLQAWPVMIGAGILHGYWPIIPDFSYWESFWLTWAWGVVWVSVGRTVEFKDAS